VKALVILIFLFFALNALAVDTRPTLLQSFDHRERSIVAEMNQLVYMLFDHDDEYLAYRLTTPGFVEADALVLEEQMKILSEKIYTNQDHQWEKKSFYYVKKIIFSIDL